MKFKAMRLLVTGKIRTAQQAAEWLAGTGEAVTPETRQEFQDMEAERDRYKVRPKVVAEYRAYYQGAHKSHLSQLFIRQSNTCRGTF